MADALKEFSTHSDKNLTQMKAGVTLASTTGSQTAVVKDIHITNDTQRPVHVRLGSTTGQKVFTCGNSGSYNGNEILDNSQSIIAHTDSELLITDFVQRGWGDGQYSYPDNEESRGPTHTYKTTVKHQLNNTPVFTPNEWDGDFNGGDQSEILEFEDEAMPESSGSNTSIKKPSNHWRAANGDLYAIGTGNDHWGMNGANLDKQLVYRMPSDASAARSYIALGSEHDHDIHAWDGSRYFYTMRHDHNYMRKYDTQTLGTSNTYASISLYDCLTSDTTALQVYAQEHSCGSYFLDGLICWTATNSGAVGSRFTVTDVASGKSKALYDPKVSYQNGVSSYSSSRIRRSMGMAKDKYGDYWAVICSYNSESSSTGHNFWAFTNMGSDPKTTYIPNSEGSTIEASAKKTVVVDMNSGQGGGNNSQLARRFAAADGRYFTNPRGFVVWSPTVTGKLYFYGRRYNQSSDMGTNSGNNFHFYALDINKVADGEVFNLVTRYASSQAWTGAMEIVANQTEGDAAWGKVSLTTKGILTT